MATIPTRKPANPAIPLAVVAVACAVAAGYAFAQVGAAKADTERVRAEFDAYKKEQSAQADRMRGELTQLKAIRVAEADERARIEAEQKRKPTPAILQARMKAANPDYPGDGVFLERDGHVIEVNLRGKRIVDISPLKGVPIQRLYLSNNAFTNIEALRNMPLELLEMSGCRQMMSLEPLADSKRLTHLNVRKCPVESLEPLRGQPLKVLDVYETRVADISPLTGMPLEIFVANGTPVGDLSPLRGAPLRELHLWNTQVADLDALRGMALEKLMLGGSRNVTDISPLADLELEKAGLKELSLNHIGATDFSALKDLPLEWLDLRETKITDISVLSGKKLRFLGLFGTGVADIAVLKDMPLNNLDIGGTQVTDIAPLTGMKSLKRLGIKGLALASRAPLETLTLDSVTE